MIESPVKTRVDPKEYRKPMTVTEYISGYAVCPRCKISMDRDYVKFCDRCGQRLAWKIPLVKKPR